MDKQHFINDPESAFWLHLSCVAGVGYKKALEIKRKAAQNDVAISGSMSPSQWQKIGVNQNFIEHLTKDYQCQKENIMQWVLADGQRCLMTPNHPYYPKSLLHISSPPMVMFAQGNNQLLNEPQIAVVGSRGPSPQGKQIARQLTESLCEYGWAITSGLAVGIDGACHHQALLCKGKTIGVLGCGIDQIYPKRHRELYQKMMSEQGCIISEFAPGVTPKPEYFPRRNRMISGLSKGVLVVEAAIKSGSLITARYAAEQGKEVFAVPGNIFNPLAKGCHWLIQQGAKLATCVEDINEEFHTLNLRKLDKEENNIKKNIAKTLASSQLLDSVDYEVTTLDKVTQRTGLPVTVVLAELLEYELQGWVASVQGGYIKLRGN